MKTKLITALAVIALSVSVAQAKKPNGEPEKKDFQDKRTRTIDYGAYMAAMMNWRMAQRQAERDAIRRMR